MGEPGFSQDHKIGYGYKLEVSETGGLSSFKVKTAAKVWKGGVKAFARGCLIGENEIKGGFHETQGDGPKTSRLEPSKRNRTH